MTHDTLTPNATETANMLAMLCPDGGAVTFQAFDDNADRKQRSLAKTLHGELDELMPQLTALNRQGAGVYVTINQTNGKGRTASDIITVRGLFVDFDTQDADRVGRLLNLELPPSLIVESSPKRHHAYWFADGIALADFTALQKRLITHFTAQGDAPDKGIHDLPRVLRLAGFYHVKVSTKKGLTGEPFLARIVHTGQRHSLDKLMTWLDSLATPKSLETANKRPASRLATPTKGHNAMMVDYLFDDAPLPKLTADQVRLLARGRWQTILGKLGYAVPSHQKDHAPCPVCGGDDRFRFDDEHGTGSFICSQGTGEPINGDGLSLLIDHAGMTVGDAVEAVTVALNDMGLLSAYDDPNTPSEWAEPEPLATDPTKPTPYPIDAFTGVLRGAVEAIAYHAQVPTAMAGQCVLGALSHMGQRFINAPSDGMGMPASLFLICEGESGSGKTQALGLSHYQIKQWERQQYQDYLMKLNEWEADLKSLKGDERKKYLNDIPKPYNPITLFTDTTIEPILDRFLNNEMVNASWTTDEAGQFFNGHTMKSDTAGNALGALTTLYSNGEVGRLRSQKSNYANPRTNAYNVRMTFLLMGQRIYLEPALTNPELNGQGFLARCLIACPEDLMGKRNWQDRQRRNLSPYDDPHLLEYWQRCRELLDPVASNDPNQTDGKRLTMRWDSLDAEQYFYEQMQRIENRQGKGGAFEYLKAYASRMAENALRIASLMAFFDGHTMVSMGYLTQAFMLVEYSINERLRYLDATPLGVQNDSERLSQWLASKAKNKPDHKLNRSFVYNGCPVPMRKDNRALNGELAILESAGHIRQETEGKAKQVIFINPKLYPA